MDRSAHGIGKLARTWETSCTTYVLPHCKVWKILLNGLGKDKLDYCGKMSPHVCSRCGSDYKCMGTNIEAQVPTLPLSTNTSSVLTYGSALSV